VVAIALVPLFIAVAPAIVVEELGPIRGMRRSWRLMRPRFWPVLGIALLSGLIANILGSILGTPFSLVAVAIGYDVGWPLLALGAILPALVTTPFIAIVATLIYFDGRIRHEGFDLQVVAADLARTGVATH
jgi:sterol desaturase/sphingolipid hydroxylase (fatty acid hydroxylase superfamily)